MKIGISTSVIQRGKTGVAQYVFALVKALSVHTGKHQINLFVLEEDLELFAFAKETMRLVPVPERRRPPVHNIWWHQTVLPRLCRQMGLDVIHVPSYRRMLWSAPCPRVATIHDLAPFHVRGKYDPARMLYGRVAVRQLARRQDQIIAISHNTARDIEQFFGIPRARQNVIHNGIDHARFFPGDQALAARAAARRWNLEAPYFLYVSRLEHPAKNHVRLIAAFEQFKRETGSPWLLALAGSDWHGAEAIHAAAERSPFRNDIRFLGFVEDPALPDLYRAAGALVFPSLFEGFGLPPVEAMACGCPVISSARGSLAEVIGAAAVVVDPEDTNSMARELERMATSPAERERCRTAGLRNAARFDWAANAAAVVSVWESATRNLLGSSRSAV